MPKGSDRLMQFFVVLLLASVACTFPLPTLTPTPTLQPAATSANATAASTAPASATNTSAPPVLQTYTPTLQETPTSTPTLVSVVPTQNLLGCPGYLDASSCAVNGCLWDKAGDRCRNKTKACAQNKTLKSCTNAGCSWNFKFKNCY